MAVPDGDPGQVVLIGPQVARNRVVGLKVLGLFEVTVTRDFEQFQRELRLDPQILWDVARLSSSDLARAAALGYEAMVDTMTQRRLPRHARGEYALRQLVERLTTEERRRVRQHLLDPRGASVGSAIRTPIRAFRCRRARKELRTLLTDEAAQLTHEDREVRAALLSLDFPLRIAYVLSEVLGDRRDVAAILGRPGDVVSQDVERAHEQFEAALASGDVRQLQLEWCQS